jgi:hypothetical protein
MSPTSSHVVEGDPSSWKTSYVESAANIFTKDVPVCVKGESAERIEDLTVRMLMGLNKQKQSKARKSTPKPTSPSRWSRARVPLKTLTAPSCLAP